MNIYKKTINFLKKIYPHVKGDFKVEVGVTEDKEKYWFTAYFFLSNIPFDIRYKGGEWVYIDEHIFYDFRKIKKYINKIR